MGQGPHGGCETGAHEVSTAGSVFWAQYPPFRTRDTLGSPLFDLSMPYLQLGSVLRLLSSPNQAHKVSEGGWFAWHIWHAFGGRFQQYQKDSTLPATSAASSSPAL